MKSTKSTSLRDQQQGVKWVLLCRKGRACDILWISHSTYDPSADWVPTSVLGRNGQRIRGLLTSSVYNVLKKMTNSNKYYLSLHSVHCIRPKRPLGRMGIGIPPLGAPPTLGSSLFLCSCSFCSLFGHVFFLVLYLRQWTWKPLSGLARFW